jgi:hypothetical protein
VVRIINGVFFPSASIFFYVCYARDLLIFVEKTVRSFFYFLKNLSNDITSVSQSKSLKKKWAPNNLY